MADGVWKVVYPMVFGRSCHLLLKKIFDDGGGRKKIKRFLVAKNVVASRPPKRRPTGTPTTRAKITVKIMATNVDAIRPPNGDRLQR